MIDTIELDDRIAKCEKILAADNNSQIFAALADAYRKKGEINLAREICLEGLKNHPNYSSARVVLAKIHISEGNFTAAREELNRAIESSGRSRAIDILEAEIYIRLGKETEAKVLLERLYLSDPEDELVLNLMSMIGEEKPAYNKEAKDLSEKMARKRSYSLADIVSLLKIIPRVMGVVAVAENGLVLEGRFDGSISKEEIGALSKGIFDLVSSGGDKIRFGVTSEVLIETQSSKLWIFNKQRYLLIIYARDDVSMGSLKLKIENLLSKADISIGVE
jgi:predicted regulator of Ras-like GTPase activity (Roadblock/LC7/MglB family)